MLPSPFNRSNKTLTRWIATACLLAYCALAFAAAPALADPSSPYSISIIDKDLWVSYGIADGYAHSLGGRYERMCVYVDTAAGPVLYASAFEFLVCSDELGITFIGAAAGVDLPADWEYVSYRTTPIDDLCAACPSNSVRMVGFASLSGGAAGLPLAGCILELTYYLSADCNYTGSCEGIKFCALDCGDNVITSGDGDSLFIPFAGITPGPDYDSAACLVPSPEGPLPVPCVDFSLGAICNDNFCEDADLNLNGIMWEIGDAVIYSNYFIYGPEVWHPIWGEVQIIGSDINNDGRTLTIADLVYLIWIIGGQGYPYPSAGPAKTAALPLDVVEVQSKSENGAMRIQTRAAVGVAAIHLVYQYSDCQPGAPEASLPPGIVMGSSARNGELRIAIHPNLQTPGIGYLPGENEILSIPIEGQGEMKLVEVQFSDAEGRVLEAKVTGAVVPDRFTLHQNFPNPFNAATVIPYTLQEDAWVTLEIVDILGRMVARPVDELQVAGSHRLEWRGTDNQGESVSSGMYFYRLTVGSFVETKKMVLLK